MPPIGDTLREARMRQGLDIGAIEVRTKIRAKYLRALENEEFGALPGHTFVKTFIRTYAEELGLDPHLLVEEYRANHEAPDELDLQPLSGAAPGSKRREPRRSPRRAPRVGPPGPGAVAVGVVVLLLGFLLVLGLTGGEDSGDGGDQASQTATTDTRERVRERERARRERARRERRRRARARPTSVSLRVEPQLPTYACLDTGPDTERIFEGILSEARTFKGKKVRVNLGKRSVKLVVNGKGVRVEQGPSPIGFEFTPGGRKELTEGERPCA